MMPLGLQGWYTGCLISNPIWAINLKQPDWFLWKKKTSTNFSRRVIQQSKIANCIAHLFQIQNWFIGWWILVQLSYWSLSQYFNSFCATQKNKHIDSFLAKQAFSDNWIIFSFKAFMDCKLINIIKFLLRKREKVWHFWTFAKWSKCFAWTTLDSLFIMKSFQCISLTFLIVIVIHLKDSSVPNVVSPWGSTHNPQFQQPPFPIFFKKMVVTLIFYSVISIVRPCYIFINQLRK